jgi:hypothetical protein
LVPASCGRLVRFEEADQNEGPPQSRSLQNQHTVPATIPISEGLVAAVSQEVKEFWLIKITLRSSDVAMDVLNTPPKRVPVCLLPAFSIPQRHGRPHYISVSIP